jgi:hypothetical protein
MESQLRRIYAQSSSSPPPRPLADSVPSPMQKEKLCIVVGGTVQKEAYLDAYKPPEAVKMLTEMLLLLMPLQSTGR